MTRGRRLEGGTAVAAVGLAGLLAACAPEPPLAPWRHLDLAYAPHRLEGLDGKRLRGRAARLLVPLGPSDLRQLVSGSVAAAPASPPPVSSGRVMALAQAPGTRLVFGLALGDEPFLEFRPAMTEGSAEAATLRVLVETAGGEEEVWRERPRLASWPPAELETVELERYRGQQIELVLEIQPGAGTGGRALWMSPALVDREPAPAPPAAPRDERFDLVLIGADTLRADALGTPGGRPSWTPALDELARESDVWSAAFSTFNITVPSFASILTGLYAKQHGVYGNETRLPADAVTLAEVLRGEGYATGAFLSARHLFSADLAQGFEEVSAPQAHQAGELAANQAMNWIAERREPFFAWVHLYDPHTPHTPPGRYGEGYRPTEPAGLAPPDAWEPFRRPGPLAFTETVVMGHRELYAGEVAYLDRQVDRLLGFLRSRDRLARTVVAFVADHGENLGENDIHFRHAGMWDSVVRVPLMIRWAGRERRGRRFDELVQTLDLFPTLLGGLGIEPPPSAGRDLLELAAEGGREAVFAEQTTRRGEMVRTRAVKYFRSRSSWIYPAGEYLYDVTRDPGERRNLAAERVALRDELARALDDWTADRAAPGEIEAAELDSDELEELRSLGYVD